MTIKFYGTGTDGLQRREVGNAGSHKIKYFLGYWENGDIGYILHY
jgi:hypothetical protein